MFARVLRSAKLLRIVLPKVKPVFQTRLLQHSKLLYNNELNGTSNLTKTESSTVEEVVKRPIEKKPQTEGKSPLRIAYFGSDDFSINALRHLLPLRDEGEISIDIFTRVPKAVGRGLAVIKTSLLDDFATMNGLNLEHVDNGFQLMKVVKKKQLEYDLAIAVSYGAKIPEKFINELQYGGLNVHPSLLPKYKGSSPIFAALMNDDKYTGVTVQTLHPTKFDAGDIVTQSEEIPIFIDIGMRAIIASLARKGGEMLLDIIKNEKYKKEYYLSEENIKSIRPYEPSWTTKVDASQKQIKWDEMTATQVLRHQEIFGPKTYTFLNCHPKIKPTKKCKNPIDEPHWKRVIIGKLQPFRKGDHIDSLQVPGDYQIDQNRMNILCKDNTIITCLRCQFECFGKEEVLKFEKKAGKRRGQMNYLKRFEYVDMKELDEQRKRLKIKYFKFA